jgi:hypothetical protein
MATTGHSAADGAGDPQPSYGLPRQVKDTT